MKTHLLLTHGFLVFTLAASAQQGPKVRDAITPEQFEALQKERLAQSKKELGNQKLVEGKDPSKENQPGDILTRSDILCFNGLATLVPKQAILSVPAKYADRIGMKTGAKLVGWLEFYSANRGWVSTEEVTLIQARGEQPLSDVLNERISKSGNVIVSTLQGGPISKLQYTPPTPPPTNESK